MTRDPESEATSLRSRALALVLSNALVQKALARAVGTGQRALRTLITAETVLLHAAGLACRSDYDPIRKQVARMKRKTRELSEAMAAARALPRAAPEEPAPAPGDAPVLMAGEGRGG